jgi:GT2 family glycosyltransferase
MTNLSVIIPLGPHETAWKELLPDLTKLPNGTEVILPNNNGRAQQMNTAAMKAKHEFLWFVHADSRFTVKTIPALLNSIKKAPNALHYFNLQFDDKMLRLKLNILGVWLRSHLLGMPFGDQDFCIAKKLFSKIGGYPEDVAYGEDHLFVWRAKQDGIKLHCTGATLLTSAREYKEQGWLYTTLKHQRQWLKLLKKAR